MHLKRQETSKKLPLTRKGTKFVVRTSSHLNDSVPVLIAIRDMLKLARTAAEVKMMIHNKMLKINGKTVSDFKESIKLMNLFEADKAYILTLLPTGRFVFQETKEKSSRVCKVVSKKILSKGKLQFNLHDGTNIISDKKIEIQDSVILTLDNKLKDVIKLDKGSNVESILGKYVGQKGKVQSMSEKEVSVKFEGKDVLTIVPKRSVIAI